jgi:hypothetical protein
VVGRIRRSDEEKDHEQVKEEMKTRKIPVGIGRNPSSPNLTLAHPAPSMPTSSLPPSSLPAGYFIPLSSDGQGLYSSESSLRVFRRV